MAQASIPQWEVSDLLGLQQKGQLSGIPAYALAGTAENESGGEVRGAGVNPEGYGGYFGDSTSVIPAADLNTSSRAEFDSQAQIVAKQMAGYGSPAGVLGDVAIYNVGGGGSNNGLNWSTSQDATIANSLSSGPLTGTADVGLSGGGTAGSAASSFALGQPSTSTSTSTVGIGSLAQLPSPSILDWITDPIGSAAVLGWNSTITTLLPVFFFVLGVILVVWGLSVVAKGGGQSITVQQAKPSMPARAEKDAEHGAEDAAVVAE